jgi:PTH1 family peptidyl-tRNA hydrolase
MKLIVGLGNPGSEYTHTRHNVGFMAVDSFLEQHACTSCGSKFPATIAETRVGSEKVLVVKPTTFMNLSGQAVVPILQFYKLDAATDLLVVHDEIDLPFGTLREAFNSSHAGHNGVRNIIEELGHQNFHRLRIGVESRGSDNPQDTSSFVLTRFTASEEKELTDTILPGAVNHITKFIAGA